MRKLTKFSYGIGVIGGGLAIGTIWIAPLGIAGLACLGTSIIGFTVDRFTRPNPNEVTFVFENDNIVAESTVEGLRAHFDSNNALFGTYPVQAFQPTLPNVTINIPIPSVQISPPILTGYNAMVNQIQEPHMELEESTESIPVSKPKKAVKTSI